MKNFQEYLAESQRTYNYRVKIVGDVEPAFVKALEEKLKQFDPVKVSAVKKTPIQAKPADFPAAANESVSSMDCEFRYPAIEPQIQQIAQLLGLDPNRIRLLTTPYEESVDVERERVEEENKDLLTDTDYPAPNAEQRALSKDYSAEPHDHAVLKNAYRSEFTVAGGKTPPAKTTNDLPMGVKSPMSTVKLPPRPVTGFQSQGKK
jgi:pyruvate/2-oxoglutarate dehydrogenase complex dihydrolipoamide acyltransferase (E2) component